MATNSGNPQSRAHRALTRILGNPTRATIGWRKREGEVLINVPGRANYVYVTKADATVLIARNEANVPRTAFYPVRMVLRENTWVIVGRDSSNAATLSNLPDDDYGVPSHPHALASLSDVQLTNIADDEVLQWDATAGKFVNVEPPIGPEGPPGPQGDPGPPGADGADGEVGGFGGDSLEYAFSTTTTDSDPGSGTLRFNHATFASITQLFIDNADATGASVTAWLAALAGSTSTVKGVLRVFALTDPTIYRIFQVTAVTAATGYYKLSVSPITQNGTLTNSAPLVVSWARTGDKGDTGATGAAGATGATGATGSQGPRGYPGGNSSPYTYSTTTTDSDPGSGVLRFNHATFASITQLFLDDNNADGTDVQGWLGSFDDLAGGHKGLLNVVSQSSPNTFRLFKVTAVTETSGYWKVSVAPVTSSGTLANNDPVIVSFAYAGTLFADGSIPLTGDWDIGDGRKLKLERIDARDADGLKFYDDGGTLIMYLEDGGLIAFGGTDTQNGLVSFLNTPNLKYAAFYHADYQGRGFQLATQDYAYSVSGSVLQFNLGGGSANVDSKIDALAGGKLTAANLILQSQVGGKVQVGLTSVGATVLGIKAGNSSNDAAVGGVLKADATQVSLSGALTYFLQYSIPLNTMSANGMSLTAKLFGTQTNTAGSKTLLAQLNGNTIFTTGLSSAATNDWQLELEIFRRSATVAVCVATLTQQGTSPLVQVNTVTVAWGSAMQLNVYGTGGAGLLTCEAARLIYHDTNS